MHINEWSDFYEKEWIKPHTINVTCMYRDSGYINRKGSRT